MAGRSSGSRFGVTLGVALAIPIALASGYSVWRTRSVVAGLGTDVPLDPSYEPAPPPPPPAPKEPGWGRDVDGVVFMHLLETMLPPEVAALEDVAPDAPYRIDLLRRGDVPIVAGARVDLDRDGRWDEVWSAGDGAVFREVSPEDDGRHTERHRWTGRTWERVAAPPE